MDAPNILATCCTTLASAAASLAVRCRFGKLVKDGEIIWIDPDGPLITQPGSAAEMFVQAATGGLGVPCLFEDWL